MNMCIHVYIDTCMYVYIYAWMYLCMYVSVYAKMYICVYVWMYLCLYVYGCLDVCMYICLCKSICAVQVDVHVCNMYTYMCVYMDVCANKGTYVRIGTHEYLVMSVACVVCCFVCLSGWLFLCFCGVFVVCLSA